MNKFFFIFFILSVLLFSCHSKKDKKDISKNNIQPSFQGYVVKPSVLDQSISVSGSLKPFEETVLMPESSGRIIKINLPEGNFVKEGTLLVKIFDGDLQASLKKKQTELEIKEQTYKRRTELLKVNGISQSDYDQTVLDLHSTKADIEILQTQIRKTEVLAPFDGVIGLRSVSIGAVVTPATTLASIRMINKLKLDFAVPEKYTNIRAGMKIKFTLQGEDKHYDALVLATEKNIEASTRNLKVRAIVTSKSEKLTPGAFANVELSFGENKNALMIPSESIIPQERNKKVVLIRDGKAVFTKIKTGVRQSSKVEVTEGLKTGDTIVTNGILFIKDGMKIKLSSVKSN